MANKIAAIQMVSSTSIGPNLFAAQSLLEKAVDEGAELVVLPECFSCMPKRLDDLHLNKETFGSGRVQDFVAEMAQRFNVWVIGGTIPIAVAGEDRAYAASIVWDAQGQVVAHYNKIHLFDIYLAGSGEDYRESASYLPGDTVQVVETPVGNVGLSVCYDLRFPELYRALRQQGAEILAVPSAFTAATGKMHWQTLLTARAIENQCYVVAPNQGGVHENGRETYGHTMIVGPWGINLGCHKQDNGYVVADVDLVRLEVLREEFPVWSHVSLLEGK